MRWFPFTILLVLGLAAAGAAEPFESVDPTGWFGRARIGVQVQPMTPELRAFFEAPEDRGVLVVRVLEASPAEKAGVRVGDVITRAGGEPVEKPFDLVRRVATAEGAEPFEISLHREGEAVELAVKPEGRALPWPGNERWEDLGEHWRRGLREGRDVLRDRLEDLERRLEELERERHADDSFQPGRPT
ncbi:MAG: hypothetical protein CL910_11915 [Deltaproteobacteria bacterium]|jgi:membrane-associated protease RseP (regulator of RpoE activity)|nr:hypothetical protein [Deltaproteobacteria bacterium]